MRWTKRNEYWVESDTGYRISKAGFNCGGAKVYTAWAPRPERNGEPLSLRHSDELQECMDACEAHAKGVSP